MRAILIAATVSFTLGLGVHESFRPLPCSFANGRLVIAAVVEGHKAEMTVDSGAFDMLTDAFVRRWNLASARGTVRSVPGVTVTPRFAPGFPRARADGGRFLVVPQRALLDRTSDGILGPGWLQGKVWFFDYRKHRFGVLTNYERSRDDLTLSFRRDAFGARIDGAQMPRIRVSIDNERLDMLLDTGASVRLTAAALAQMRDGWSGLRGASFIDHAHFARWRRLHPNWKSIPDAVLRPDGSISSESLIEVPRVTIGRVAVGPVWFTTAPDALMSTFSSESDLPVAGDLGPSALKYLTFVLDYPNARMEIAN